MKLNRNINADRVCEAISRIGYQTHAAIEDVVDNSIAAKATEINIHFELIEGATYTDKNGISLIRITDNGSGMKDEKIFKALDLGSDVEYSSNSLSKYGLGLKSAGFSLGRKIVIYSKVSNEFSSKQYLDRDSIKSENSYVSFKEDLNDSEKELITSESGTVVEFSKINSPIKQLSKIVDKLKSRLGVIYSSLLAENQIKITLSIGDKSKNYTIEPIDILYINDAESVYDPDNYKGDKPIIAFNKSVDVAIDLPPVNVKLVFFPQKKMASFAGFTPEEKSKILSYEVSRENSGFFIYRNGRLIRWGDSLGILGRDDITIRCSIEFESSHDDLFLVDVSKQNLELSDHFLDSLQTILRIPIKDGRHAAELCYEKLNDNNNHEAEKANATLEDITEEDISIELTPEKNKERIKRRKHKAEQSKLEEANETNDPVQSQEPEFQRIRYSDNLNTELFKPGFDQEYGTYIRINRKHAFYQIVLNSFPSADKARVAIEALLWTLAFGENSAEQNLKLPQEDIQKVFEHFQTSLSFKLHSWVFKTQDIFNK